mgnify:CR=1 FL=1
MTHTPSGTENSSLRVAAQKLATPAKDRAPTLPRRVILATLLVSIATACGQTEDSGTTNVQSGAARAPGAAPAPKP